MGWKCNIYYFCRRAEVFIRYLREPLPNPTGHPPASLRTRSPSDKDPPDATCATRGGEAPDYSRTWTTLFCRQERRSSIASRPRLVPTRPPRARTQPQERPLGAYTKLRAPRPPCRHYNLYLPSPYFETARHCHLQPEPTATRYTRRPMATSPTTCPTRL
jgi:hypothetical protein